MTDFSKKTKLTNGLSVIYEKNDNANIVAIYLGVKVGAVDETNAESGLCHLIEHMVFKGTKSYQPGEIATLVESHGGELNAYTSFDQTVYYITLPSKHFSLGLKLIKEMVFDAEMDPLELEREKEVVIEEIRRGQDNPQRVLGENLFKTVFKKHNYGRPVIGTAKNVQGFSPEKVKSFYKTHYTPQNMILGVCGNIKEAELSKELERLFRFEVNRPLTKRNLPPEPAQKSHRIHMEAMDIQATYFDIAFRGPELTHKDVPALDILSHLLGEAETSLLEQETKEKEQLVHSIYTSCYTPKYPGVILIGGLVDPKLINKAFASIKKQIQVVCDQPFDHETIERAKLLARSQSIYEQQTCEGTTRKWITFETTGSDYLFSDTYLEAIEKLTAQDIQRVAGKYFDVSKSSVVVLHSPKAKIKIDKSFFKKAQPSKTKNRFKKLRHRKDTGVYKLDNGIRVLLKENHRLPLVALRTASLGGIRYETAKNNGINQLLSNVMVRSTANLSQRALAEKCEWLAGGLSSYTGRNSLGLSFSFLSEKTKQALPILSDVLLHPAYRSDEVAKEKALLLEAIKNRGDNPSQTCFRQLLQKLFQGHPYQWQGIGEKASVKSLTPKSLANYCQKIITPKNLVLAAVGDFDTGEFLDQLNSQLGALPQRAFQPKKLKTTKTPSKQIKLFHAQNKQQAHIAIGFKGASLYDKDRYTLELINNILSGQGGRLFLELRDKKSLAYTVTSTMVEGLETGFFGAYIGTEPRKIQTAIDEIFIELKKLHDKPISTAELERAKNYIIGNHEIDHQKNGAIAMQLALNELYGKGLEEFYDFQKQVNRITKADVQRVAKKYIKLNKCIISVVGPKGSWK